MQIYVNALYIPEINECESEPCVNGTCVDGVGAFTCECDFRFTGEICDTGTLSFFIVLQFIQMRIILINYALAIITPWRVLNVKMEFGN